MLKKKERKKHEIEIFTTHMTKSTDFIYRQNTSNS